MFSIFAMGHLSVTMKALKCPKSRAAMFTIQGWLLCLKDFLVYLYLVGPEQMNVKRIFVFHKTTTYFTDFELCCFGFGWCWDGMSLWCCSWLKIWCSSSQGIWASSNQRWGTACSCIVPSCSVLDCAWWRSIHVSGMHTGSYKLIAGVVVYLPG